LIIIVTNYFLSLKFDHYLKEDFSFTGHII